MSSPGTIRFVEINTTPAAPPVGSAIIYIKTDNVIYLQDSNGIEIALGTASGITSLTGEATGTGPGAAVVTLSNSAIIGKVLTGFVSGPNSTVLSTDTLLQAIQKLQSQVSAGSGSAITSLTGDVTGSGPGATATTVAFVGTKSAASIATSVNDTQTATSINTASTIVKRDASGNFSANTITATTVNADLTGNVTGSASNNVLKSGDTMTGPLLNSNTTQSTTKDTGSVILEGGLGVEKNINAGGTILGSNISGSTSGTNTGDITVTDSNTVDLTLSAQNIQADVRISNSTLTSDAGGLKVGTVPAAQVSGLATVATSGDYSDLSGTPSSLPPSGTAGGDLSGSYPNPNLSTTKQNYLLDRTNHTGTQLSSTISDFNEAAQDAVGTILSDSSSIDFTYNDAGNSISAAVLPAGVDHNSLNNYVANEHVDHSTVSISAGTGLTGGGDITANRTISMPAVGTAATYGSASQVPVLTTDTQGRVSSVTNTTISITSSEITDFNEAAQDAVGATLTDTATIDFTYNDAGNTISAIVVDGSITDIKVASGIDAAKLADGSVSNTEFQYINSVTSNVQTQLNDRELLANKATDLSILNNTLYPTTQAVQSAINTSILVSPIFILSALNSDISGYKSLIPLASYVSTGLTTISQTVTTSETLMEEFSTNVGIPSVTALASGIISFHYEMQKSSGPQFYYSYVKVFKRNTLGVETLLLTSDISNQISDNAINQITVIALNPSIIPLVITDRIIIKVYAIMVSGSQSIALRYDDNTDARTQFPGASLNYVAENIANKSTDGTLSANSTILYPSQSAVKTYADTKAPLLHAAQHLPSGSDPLATAAPLANLSASTTNAAGTAESFSKSDHSHDISTGAVSTQTPDQSNAEGSSANLARADHVHNIPSGSVVQIGTSNFNGASASFALADHVHSHGNQTSGTLHAVVTNSTNGFMSAADKIKLDTATALATASTLVFRDASGNFAANTITANLTGNASGSALSFTGNLVGDVTGTQSATVVDQVGGKTSAEISTSVDDTLAATDASTFSTIVKRDGGGKFSAVLVTSDLVGDVTGTASGNIIRTGDTMTGKFVVATITLTDAATILTDTSLGNTFTVTIAGNRTFAAPTSPVADQKIVYKIRQDAVGGRIITWNAAFNFGVDLSGVPNSTSANTFDYYGFQYNATTSKWDCLAISRGY